MIGWFRADLYWKVCWIVFCMHVAFFTSLFLRDERTFIRTRLCGRVMLSYVLFKLFLLVFLAAIDSQAVAFCCQPNFSN